MNHKSPKARLVLGDGSIFEGKAYGAKVSKAGEVVFSTGMTGYDLSLTDPSYAGQILTFTYPLIGNWGVPPKSFWESSKIHPVGLVISDLTTHPNHWHMETTLNNWLIQENVPAITGIDTRALTQKLREKGVMLGKIIVRNEDIDFVDPNERNLVAEVSINELKVHKSIVKSQRSNVNIGLLNCGAKQNIIRCLTTRGATVYELPWNYDPFEIRRGVAAVEGLPSARSLTTKSSSTNEPKIKRALAGGKLLTGPRTLLPKLDGLVISNGPGNPKMAKETIAIIKIALKKKIPTFGICLGNQLLALAAGGDTYKLKFGHRAQNQPTIEIKSKRCYITTQNHGFAVDDKKLPSGFKRWFYNANDNSNEGIAHVKLPFFSVQFHPEAAPGPTDTEFLFDKFMEKFK
ncbi:MAG: Bifunctional pyrimidine biosynthesis protein (PyrABCN) [Candidatus Curtissbacteria bacterium GW2011_GWA1_40_9]|uniref:Carbamoyl phosphate synthase small chain n=1 Tax=Candidatus Curtissbacteria bacterium GW2011_GWA1_40_9 TaxID=1618408 RepID=A0A0G0TMQ6_9BACT|nr:MAG: Bifunctional pyrimidine biosynthesis protein (PyrABCN) [Candidatus Curtissbacteria bacterium GW2011_GWA1_40_9]